MCKVHVVKSPTEAHGLQYLVRLNGDTVGHVATCCHGLILLVAFLSVALKRAEQSKVNSIVCSRTTLPCLYAAVIGQKCYPLLLICLSKTTKGGMRMINSVSCCNHVILTHFQRLQSYWNDEWITDYIYLLFMRCYMWSKIMTLRSSFSFNQRPGLLNSLWDFPLLNL